MDWRHALAAMVRNGMSNLMADHRGQSELISSNGKKSRINTYFASGQTKGVGLFTLENDKLPLCAR